MSCPPPIYFQSICCLPPVQSCPSHVYLLPVPNFFYEPYPYVFYVRILATSCLHPVHFWFTSCLPPVHLLSTYCSDPVCLLSTFCPSPLHLISTSCPPHVYLLFALVYILSISCLSIHLLLTSCLHPVYLLSISF